MNFLLTICLTAIAAAVFRIMVPENKFTKQITLLISCVFILSGINAISGTAININSADFEITDGSSYISFSGDVNKQLQKQICKEMSDKLYSLLNKNGIYPEQIHIGVNISGLYSISITQVKLVLGKDMTDQSAQALALLKQELSDDIEIIIDSKR